MQGARDSCKCHLPDGSCVDICTEEGANAFLQSGSSDEFQTFSGNVETLSQIRSKRRLNAGDKQTMIMLGFTIDSLAQYADNRVFRQCVPESEIRAWLNYTIEEIQKLSTNRNWISTGNLQQHDAFVLNPCISMMMHAVPTVMVFESDFFQVLAEFVRARKADGRALPSTDICETITLIVSNAYMSTQMAFDNKWTTEKTLKKLEATGVLVEFIRCATVPQPGEQHARGFFRMLDEMQTCTPFLSKKFQKGEPCGDIVHAILEGKDGSRTKRPSLINKLMTIVKFVDSMNTHPDTDAGGLNIKMCRNCNKSDRSEAFQKSLMQCARCQSAYYCSKECQRTDWPKHKKTCAPSTKSQQKIFQAMEKTVMTFCQNQYVHIMFHMVEACAEYGVTKNEMLLALNFKANAEGIVPAMQDPPEMKIAPVKDYIEGTRPAEPDWFFKNEDNKSYEKNIKNCIKAIKDQQSRRLPKHVLCLVNYAGGTSCFKVQLMEPVHRNEMYSDEAFQAFAAYINDDDVGPLSRIFGPAHLRTVKQQLGIHYGIGEPDEDLVMQTRQILNNYLGRDAY
ncbi:unnamed protein product [Cylindrotheca closterium]|uniref:MYND-type domain-containing protein n=1 Tax=Cylindrotheca closterium TaxID=2856 RepID=A0AAD2PXP9_9STRA|nr:unnamed protein product [Cylindrotheca closterium]